MIRSRRQHRMELRVARRSPTRHRIPIRRAGKLLSRDAVLERCRARRGREWADDGRLLGTYRMRHGTGIDCGGERPGPSPAGDISPRSTSCVEGNATATNGGSMRASGRVFIERHWRDGEQHGIEREWNNKGRLRRGFPKYFVAGQQVNRRQYLKACTTDPSLPLFRRQENRPLRAFPPEIRRHLGSAGRRPPHQGRRGRPAPVVHPVVRRRGSGTRRGRAAGTWGRSSAHSSARSGSRTCGCLHAPHGAVRAADAVHPDDVIRRSPATAHASWSVISTSCRSSARKRSI